MARLVLFLSLDILNVDYEQWHEMQLEKVVLQMIAPDATIPETAILDFIVAISVLPMATFTTISVLGGSQKMPDWMFGQESAMESLSVKQLEENTDIPAEEDASTNSFKEGTDGGFSENESSRMIDTPLDLFGDSSEN